MVTCDVFQVPINNEMHSRLYDFLEKSNLKLFDPDLCYGSTYTK